MSLYQTFSDDELAQQITDLEEQVTRFKASALQLNMARGKPSAEQTALSKPMLDIVTSHDDLVDGGLDCANYGGLLGIPRARKLMADYLGVEPEQVIMGGESSLNLMYDQLMRGMVFGLGAEKPWCLLDRVAWICPVPGYDRHFAICEALGIEMISIELHDDGPDIDEVKELVENDAAIKGIWCVPRYSNPSGCTYSTEVVEALAQLNPAAPDFRVYLDNAYAEHHLYPNQDELVNVYEVFEHHGAQDRLIMFASTSKITMPGSGISATAGSPATVAEIEHHMSKQTIGHDKVNQLRHVEFLQDMEGVRAHMKEHANILTPKFDLVEKRLTESFEHTGLATWTKPHGGYFVSFMGPQGCAKDIVARCASCGLTLTGAGAAYPYGDDPHDANIRIAPTFPTLEELDAALTVFTTCVHLVAAQYEADSRG